jgi:hypothetical protein
VLLLRGEAVLLQLWCTTSRVEGVSPLERHARWLEGVLVQSDLGHVRALPREHQLLAQEVILGRLGLPYRLLWLETLGGWELAQELQIGVLLHLLYPIRIPQSVQGMLAA